MNPPPVDHGILAHELASLARLSRAALAEKWGALYGAPPPARTSRSLMIRAVAYKLQERTYGGLSLATRRILAGLKEASAKPPPRELRSGTVLLREWQGATHRVTVIDKGVLYGGKSYKSLSEVARVITGSRWSGPRFFGLTVHAQG